LGLKENYLFYILYFCKLKKKNNNNKRIVIIKDIILKKKFKIIKSFYFFNLKYSFYV